ncbi:MAG TPA: adenosylcobinamide-GDP ribazoletransferase [Actinomycetota bacterium]|nr:adenosylcobinamide-GDP ribazoletransferase [Actinomycetota bacterium]
MRGFVIAISFLTRIPVPARVHTDRDIALGVPWFPVVGALIGVLCALIYGAALSEFPPFLSATLALTAGVLLTGAFHEDGLADTFDAFAGGWTKEERMRILKDPTHGTYGVLALALSAMLRAAAITTFTFPIALAVLPAAHAVSRSASVALLGTMRPAGEGLGASYGAAVTSRRAAVGVVIGLLIGAAGLGVWLLPVVGVVSLCTWVVGRWSLAKIGGISGDALGATQQITEIAVLAVAVAMV